jgi:adenosine deaminase
MLREYIERLPKVELHIHLEGSIKPETLLILAQENNHPVKELGIDGIRRLYNYSSFEDFLRIFKIVSECLKKPKDFYLITYNMLKAQAEQNIIYSEVLFSPGIFVMRGLDFNLIMEEVYRAMYKAQDDYGVYMKLIFDSVRQWGKNAAMDILNLAKERKDKGVIGIGIGGNEIEAPPEIFRDVYAKAKEEGFHLTAHAGEVCGPESIWNTINILNVERIGHGIYAYKDIELMDYLKENRIPLDISPTSNIKTGAIPSFERHPIKRLFDHGILITINSDDPAMFDTDLNREYTLLIEKFNFTIDDIKKLIFNGIEASFLNEKEKNNLVERFKREIDK